MRIKIHATDTIQMVDANKVDALSSPWGNSYCYITEEQLEELKNGKIIYFNDGEYGNFIELKKGEDDERDSI